MNKEISVRDWIKLGLVVAAILGVVELTPSRPTGGQYPHLKKGASMDNEIQRELDRLTIILHKMDAQIERIKVLNALEPLRTNLQKEEE